MVANNVGAAKYIFQREIPGVTAKCRHFSITECLSVVMVCVRFVHHQPGLARTLKGY